MSTSTYVALTDLYVAHGVRAYRAGQPVAQSNTHFATWKDQGLVATESSKAAKDAVPAPAADSK